MGLESATYISDLVATNPVAGDLRSEGDDHLRLIKAAVKATFPNVTGAVTSSQSELNLLDGVTGTIRTNTTSGALVLLSSATLTGASTVDFIHGTGGVVIDSTYDDYEIVLSTISSTTAGLWVRTTANAGSSWTATTWKQQYSIVNAGTASDGQLTAQNQFDATGGLTANGTAAVGVIRVRRESGSAFVSSELISGGNFEVAVRSSGRTAQTINGIRVMWSAGTFFSGTARLYGRKP